VFKCKQCGETEIQLLLRSPVAVRVNINDVEEVEITAEGREPFVADLAFANRFARCPNGHTRQWAYYFPSVKN
jgi:hypothetical protein